MIILHGSGRRFGLPDSSPFVTKVEVLLRMAAIPYEYRAGNLKGAPKGKIPHIVDDGVALGDSTFIRWHLEQKHGANFSGGYSPAELAAGWAFEKMCEDHLYWSLVDLRWSDEANFDRGPRKFFAAVPALIRPIIVNRVKAKVRAMLRGQGFGLHDRAEIARLAIADLKAISDFLGDKPFLLGTWPSAADATVFAMVEGISCKVFESPIRDAAEAMPNLVAYRRRMLAAYYPEGF